MKETDKKLAEVINYWLEKTKQAEGFIMDEAPELIKDFIFMKTIEHSISLILGIACIIALFKIGKHITIKMKALGYEDVGDYIEDGIISLTFSISYLTLGIIGFFLIIRNSYILIKILSAPKIYIIEYLSKMI